MATIKLLTNTDLTVDSSKKLTIQHATGSYAKTMSDGLYAEMENGTDAEGGTGYTSEFSSEGIRCGYVGPYTYEKSKRRISTTNIVHRVFDSNDEQGRDLINFRGSIDCVLIGDMYRVKQSSGKYKYFLVTFTDAQTDTGLGNYIRASVPLGEW